MFLCALLCCEDLCGGFKAFVVSSRFFANFIFSSKSPPNSHSSTDVLDSVVFIDMFRLAMIMLFLARDSSLWIEARSLPPSLSFSSSSIFPGISVLSVIEIAFPTASKHAATRSCYSTMRLSRLIADSCTAAVISTYSLGTDIKPQFSGVGYFSKSILTSSGGSPFFRISDQRRATSL